MKKMATSLLCFSCLATLAIFSLSQCKRPAPTQSFFDTIYDNTPIQLTVETDFDALLSGLASEASQTANIRLQKTAGEETSFVGKIKPRGVFRKANCAFPPLKLKFEKDELKKLGLKQYHTLKLVTHCQNSHEFEQLVLKEFLAFKLYNILTDRSFRVQLARVRYVDAKQKTPPAERFGFLVEDDEELAERLGGRILGEEHGDPKTIDMRQYKIFVLFQFMVGNTDWSLANRHNVELIQPNDLKISMPFPVPYDFDFCGMVNAPYAIAPHHLPISNVKERFFQWRGKQDVNFEETFNLFQSKRELILDTIREFELLDEHCRKEVSEYLESFFEMLETPEKIVGK